MSSTLLQIFAPAARNLVAVIETANVIKELLEMKNSMASKKSGRIPISEKEFAAIAGFNYGIVNRLQSGKQKTIDLEDMEKWLIACGKSMASYFAEKATADDLSQIACDREMADDIKLALRLRRELFKEHLRLALIGVKRPGKGRR